MLSQQTGLLDGRFPEIGKLECIISCHVDQDSFWMKQVPETNTGRNRVEVQIAYPAFQGMLLE